MRRIGTCCAMAAMMLVLAVDAWAAPKQQQKGGEVVKEGKVLVVRGLEGGEPQLTDESNQRWLIVGPLREEALNLDGHKLKVWASIGGKKLTMPTLVVKRYEIVDSGGRRPVVGQLRRDAPLAFSLERKEGNLEVKAPRPLLVQLDKNVGCKVWLVGDIEGKTLKAFKFGSISCRRDKPAIKSGKERKR
jgi:hypothetical protein